MGEWQPRPVGGSVSDFCPSFEPVGKVQSTAPLGSLYGNALRGEPSALPHDEDTQGGPFMPPMSP